MSDTPAIFKAPEVKTVSYTSMDVPSTGIHDDIDNEQYHCGPGISKSGLDLINQSPAHYLERKLHPKPPTPQMELGTAFHTLVLEPDQFDKQYVRLPFDAPNRPTAAQLKAEKPTTKALESISYWKAWNEKNGDKTIIQSAPDAGHWERDDWRTIHSMKDAVLNHPIAGVLLDPDAGMAEQSVYWIDRETFKLCKCRPDFHNRDHNIIVDLKSTNDASYTGFAKSCGSFRYYVQDPFYTDGMKAVGEKVDGFVFIAVEKEPPYGVGVYILDPEAKRIGRMAYQRNLNLYAKCKNDDHWPCYPDEIRDLTIPPWGLKAHIR